jgi:hypothetical protein
MFEDSLRDELSQGDVLDEIPVVDEDDGQIVPRKIRGVVLSDDCEIDKLLGRGPAKHALVVEFRDPSGLPGGMFGQIQMGDVWNALYVPGGPRHEEGFLDFRRIYRINVGTLNAMLGTHLRLASMNDRGRRLVIYAFMSFFLHEDMIPD